MGRQLKRFLPHHSYRQNPNYHLPPSLTPTRIQRTIAHEHLIDGIIQPFLRDSMILMRGESFCLGAALQLCSRVCSIGKYNILKVFKDLCAAFEIPGGENCDIVPIISDPATHYLIA